MRPPGVQATLLTTGADGAVFVSPLPDGGGPPARSALAHRHEGRAHRLASHPDNAAVFFSCGEDSAARGEGGGNKKIEGGGAGGGGGGGGAARALQPAPPTNPPLATPPAGHV